MKSTGKKILNKLLNVEFNNFLWFFLLRRLCRLNKIYFNLSDKKKLPQNNYPLTNLNKLFETQYSNYLQQNKKLNLDIYNLFKKYFKKNSKIKLLDYGGENLDLYLFLKDKYPNIKIIVVNQLKLVNFLKKFLKKRKIENIKVFNNFYKIKNIKFDFVYFGSSLQYIKNYEKILDLVVKSSSKYIYISASSFFYGDLAKKNIIVKQLNLLPIIMYCYLLNFNFIRKYFDKKNFIILSKKRNPFKKINYRNFEFKIDYLNVLFKRNF